MYLIMSLVSVVLMVAVFEMELLIVAVGYPRWYH